jgi:geranylgeranyl diphosphate synthase type II
MSAPPRLKQAMLYSLLAGGKRLRPALCMGCAFLCGAPEDSVVPFAAAIEMIHTYSLIHDDLPAMDNDDLRRGKPSNHKAFDEATAILAGNALLTDAFVVLCATDVQPERLLKAVRYLAKAAGSSGMAGGQVWDMLYTGGQRIDLARLQTMHAMKTGAMIQASCACGAILAGAANSEVRALEFFGAAFGMAFQITDDILDVVSDTANMGKPVGGDAAKGKNTYPSVLGIAKSRALIGEQIALAKAALAGFPPPKADFLLTLVDNISARTA